MTHSDLVARAAKWLRNTKRCGVVVAELSASYSSEIPDAIGWKGPTHSILVEAKATRADFLKDARKFFRQNWDYGMGQQRFYMVPAGMVRLDELPDGWGLLYCHPKKVEVVREVPLTAFNTWVCFREMPILYSLVRRALSNGFAVDMPYRLPGRAIMTGDEPERDDQYHS